MIVYSNGCSHTIGFCRGSIEDSYISIISKSLFRDDYELLLGTKKIGYNVFKSDVNLNFFKKKSVKNNKVLINADYGKSNDTIFFETINTICELKKEGIKIDYAIIQFSGSNRRIHTLPNNTFKYVNPHDNFELGIKFEPYASLSTLQYILILQELFKKEDIEYVFIPYIELDIKTIENNCMLDFIDTKRLTTKLSDGHRNHFRKKNCVCDYAGHPNLLGNYILADKVLDILGLNDSLIGFYDYFNNSNKGLQEYLGSPSDNQKNILKKYYNKLGDGSLKEIKKFIIEKII